MKTPSIMQAIRDKAVGELIFRKVCDNRQLPTILITPGMFDPPIGVSQIRQAASNLLKQGMLMTYRKEQDGYMFQLSPLGRLLCEDS